MRNIHKIKFFKAVHYLILVIFCVSTMGITPVHAQMISGQFAGLPDVGAMVSLSAPFSPTLIKGLKVYPDQPFKFDFIVDTGESDLRNQDLQKESDSLIKYFLTTLTVPNQDLWVNLSPYEKDRIMAEGFGKTQMGRDLLAQDYLLKQITASLMYPEEEIGERFWEKVYSEVREQFDVTDIPVETFNKVWIVPSHAKIYQNAEENTVYVVDAKLKVMLEEDYFASSAAQSDPGPVSSGQGNEGFSSTTDIIREIIIPLLEKEVNEGAHFALLRQIYHSMILAAWYKKNLQESLLAQAYVGKNKVKGVDVADPEIKQRIYQQYLESFKQGVYNYIKEEYDAESQEVIPRKYFSGGVAVMDVESVLEDTDFAMASQVSENQFVVSANIVQERLSNREDFAISTQKDKTRIALPEGPTFLTRISEEEFQSLIDNLDFFKVREDVSSGRLVTETVTPRHQKYDYFDTPLDYVERSLDINIIDGIERTINRIRHSSRPDKMITIVDWGCGSGKVLDDVIQSLEEKGVDLTGIRFVGFGNLYSKRMKERHPEIEFILDSGESFDEYFEDGEIDFLMSHLGLAHIRNGDAKLKVNLRMHKKLSAEGVFIQDYFRNSLLVSDGADNLIERNDWIPDSFDVLRREQLEYLRGVLVLVPKSTRGESTDYGQEFWIQNFTSKDGVLSYGEAWNQVLEYFRLRNSKILNRGDGIEMASIVLRNASRLSPEDIIPGTQDDLVIQRKVIFPLDVSLSQLAGDKKRQDLFDQIVESCVEKHMRTKFIEEDLAMAVSPQESQPVPLLTAMPGITEVLNQPVFLNKFDREMMSYLEDEVTLENGIKIALNWVGINDGIRINFISREEFDDLKKRNGEDSVQMVALRKPYSPYYKSQKDDEISYTLPEDVTINEIRSFIDELNSLMDGDANRLDLTDESSERFHNMAIFLSKQKIPLSFSDLEMQKEYKQSVELLYYLGNFLRTDVDHTTKSFEEIQKMPLDFEDSDAVVDFIEKMKHFLKLSEHKLQDQDAMVWWTKNALNYIKSMFALAINEKFEHVIFQKGTEEFQHMGTRKSGLYTLKEGEDIEDKTLWSQLPWDDWKERFALGRKSEETQIVLELQEYIMQFKGWVAPKEIDYAPYYMKNAQEMNCLGRSTLITRILKEIGFDADRIFVGAYQGHAFLILELADGSYFSIQTYEDPMALTKEIPETVLPKYFLSRELKEKRSQFLEIPASLVTADSPLDASFTVHRITEGLMSLIKVSLLWDIYYRRLEVNPEEKIELLDFVINGFERIRLFEANEYHSVANLALAYKRKSDAIYEKDKTVSGLRVAIRNLNKAIEYQELVLKFDHRSQEESSEMEQYREKLLEYEEELSAREESYAGNLSFLDNELKKIPGLDHSLREQFRQYLIDHGLYKYENVIRLFNHETIEFLLEDTTVRPVFLEVLESPSREGIVPVDEAGLKQLGDNSVARGLDFLKEKVSFRVGTPGDADYLLRLDPSKKILVGMASNVKTFARRMNPHGRQSFILLKDGTLLGLKGSGQNLDENSPNIEWDDVKDRYNGIMSMRLVRKAERHYKEFEGTNAKLMQYLGYTRIHEVPDKSGGKESVDDILFQEKILYKPAIAMYRVPTLHRMSEFRRLLNVDEDLKNTRRHLSKALISLGRLPEGTELSGEEFVLNMMRGFGETEGIKHNKGLVKHSFHVQDLLLSGDESDNEEFRKARTIYEQLNQFRTKVFALSTMIGAIRQYEERTGKKSALLPETSSAYRALKELMTSYFSALEKKHLSLWTQESYSDKEANPWESVFSGIALSRFHDSITSGSSEMMDKKLLRDVKSWAKAEMEEKEQEDFALGVVASPEIKSFIHATKLSDLIRMMRIGKIPLVGEEEPRVYLNEVNHESPGYFGNILLYLNRDRLDENGITIYRLQDTPYFESKVDIPFDRIGTIENAHIMRDPYLIVYVDEQARKAGVENEPVFMQSRQHLLSVLFPELTNEEREKRVSDMKKKEEITFEEMLNQLPEEVSVVGLNRSLQRDRLKAALTDGAIVYMDGKFYLATMIAGVNLTEEDHRVTDISSDYEVFNGALKNFTRLTESGFLQVMIPHFVMRNGSLSEKDISELIRFGSLLADSRIFTIAQAAKNFTELKVALEGDQDYPFLAYDGALNAQRILGEKGFKGRMIRVNNPETEAPYFFVEVELLGDTLVIDLTADQFETSRKADPARFVFKPEYRDTGIVILPESVLQQRSTEKVPMYEAWKKVEVTTDFASAVNPSQQDVGGIDLNPDFLEMESEGGQIRLDQKTILENMESIEGFSPVIFQIVPVTNLPLFLGVKNKTSAEMADKLVNL